MTELCKFCVIFHRLYIDNIIKASKIKFKKYRSFFFGWCLFSFGHIYSDLKNAEEDRNRLIFRSLEASLSRTNWSVQCSVHVHTFWRNWIPPKKSTGLKRMLIDIWLTHDREWQLLHDYSPNSRIQIKGHELTHYTCFLHCTVFPCVRLMTKHLSYPDVRWAFPTNFSFPRNWSVWR